MPDAPKTVEVLFAYDDLAEKLSTPSGHVLLTKGILTIGRALDNLYAIPDPKASDHHALICPEGQGHSIVDLQSNSGTFVNGRRLTPRVSYPLSSNDTIQIGETQFAYDAISTPYAIPIVRPYAKIRRQSVENGREKPQAVKEPPVRFGESPLKDQNYLSEMKTFELPPISRLSTLPLRMPLDAFARWRILVILLAILILSLIGIAIVGAYLLKPVLLPYLHRLMG